MKQIGNINEVAYNFSPNREVIIVDKSNPTNLKINYYKKMPNGGISKTIEIRYPDGDISSDNEKILINKFFDEVNEGIEKSIKNNAFIVYMGNGKNWDKLDEIINKFESSHKKTLKGVKTSVWGKKSHRNDMVSYLENSVRKMW